MCYSQSLHELIQTPAHLIRASGSPFSSSPLKALAGLGSAAQQGASFQELSAVAAGEGCVCAGEEAPASAVSPLGMMILLSEMRSALFAALSAEDSLFLLLGCLLLDGQT